MLVSRLNSNSYKQSFGTTREKTSCGKKITNWKHTDIARQDVDWNRFIDELLNRYPKGAKIFCYGCSDGSEAYTIALKLIQKIGVEKTRKLYPIIAKDIDEQIIRKNNSGIIGLRKSIDIPEIKRCLKNTGLQIDDVIEKTSASSEKVFGVYNYEIEQYKTKGILRNLVKFETANIVEDTKNKFPKQSVVLFRNAVPYLNNNEEKQLIQNLKNNLQQESMFVVGGFDKSYSYIDKDLIENAFTLLDEKIPIIKSGKKLAGEFPLGIPFREDVCQGGVFIKQKQIKSSQVAQILPKMVISQEKLNEIFSDENLAKQVLDKDWFFEWKKAMQKNPSLCSTGFCYPAVEFMYHFVDCDVQPMIIKYGEKITDPSGKKSRKQTHYFLKKNNGFIYDPTVAQFEGEIPEYERGVKFGFLTEFPSQKACSIALKLGLISEDFAKKIPIIFRDKKYKNLLFEEKIELVKNLLAV